MTARKIFCVGFNKTGTTSLAEYFSQCGLTTCHWPSIVDGVDFEARCADVWDQPERVLDQLAPVMGAYQVHSDVPWSGLVAELMIQHPGSQFILSTRSPDGWWNSLDAHWALGARRHRMSPFERIQFQRYMPGVDRHFGREHRDELVGAFLAHREYVAETVPPDLLLQLDIDEGNIAGKLSEFTGTDPSVSFPEAAPRPASPIKAIRRIARSLTRRRRFGPGW